MKGVCLCGAVSFETNEKIAEISACHCNMCNKWSSSPFIAIMLNDKFIINGEENIAHYASSEWAERSFCKKCGTQLFYKSTNPSFHHFNAALFNIDNIDTVSLEIFIDKKPKYYNFLSNNSKKMTENDVIEYMKNNTQL
ncbi:aldehyde-activating protein [Providencia heimbachae]|uniref:GFA family protein n=1 Tax=Providencia heimbachae TaxID=333962 RepID=UPI0010BE88D1|nr:GFA family protein [Providencia heimbachae]QCJ69398.1 aldehyde-activating protein [Providencia heimbachae]